MRAATLLLVLLLPSIPSPCQRILDARLNESYKGGEIAFIELLQKDLGYPAEARTQGVMGLSVFAFKVNCQGEPYGFLFKTKLGFGFEEEIERAVKLSRGNWLPCNERDSAGWMNFKIAFALNNLYDSPDAFLKLSGNGNFPGVSDDQLVKDLERATKKNDTEKARATLTKLVMRFPYNQEYKKQLIELQRKGS